jgi:hypothetical protein
MQRIKENVRLRLEDSHEHAKSAAVTLGALGVLSVLFLNHSSQATGTFWRLLITFVVNLIPKVHYRCSRLMLAPAPLLILFPLQTLRHCGRRRRVSLHHHVYWLRIALRLELLFCSQACPSAAYG